MKTLIIENNKEVSGRKEATKEVVQFYSRPYATHVKRDTLESFGSFLNLRETLKL